MYCGVRSYQNVAACHDYESARRSLEKASKTPTGRTRKQGQFGFHLGMSSNHGVTWVRECDEPGYEGAIAFRLYNTDVVIWHPDNSVEIDNYGTVTTGGFASTFLPDGLSLAHPVERCRGASGGHKGIYYRAEPEPGESTEGWRAYSAGRRVCFGGLPRFRLHGEHWLPDEDTLDTITFPEITDRKGQREVSGKYSLRDFDNWLSMAPMHMRVEHEEWDLDECADALLKRDFLQAAKHLPLTLDTGAYSTKLKIIPIITSQRDHHVTVSTIGKLKLALWEHEGCIGKREFTTISTTEFDRRMQRVRQMRQLDIPGARTYGPPRW